MSGEEEAARGSPVRVVRLSIPSPELSEALLGPSIISSSCEIVFRHMLPAPPEAALVAVTGHGLSLSFEAEEDQPSALMVPWVQVSYVRFDHSKR